MTELATVASSAMGGDPKYNYDVTVTGGAPTSPYDSNLGTTLGV